MADPVQRPGGKRLDHRRAVEPRPVEDVRLEAAQAARPRPARSAIVEGGDGKSLCSEPGGKRPVVFLRAAHGRHDEYGALRPAFGAEKARRNFLPVGGFYKTMH